MKKNFIGLFFLMFHMASFSQTQTVGTIADGLLRYIPGVLNVLEMVAYIGGVGLTIKGVLMLKDVSESKGQIKIQTALIVLAAGVLLMGLPQFMKVGMSTLGLDSAGGPAQLGY